MRIILLAGVARLSQIIIALVNPSDSQNRRDSLFLHPYTPMAVIECASMPNQRVITSTFKDIVKALNINGEQRPPLVHGGYRMVGINAQRERRCYSVGRL